MAKLTKKQRSQLERALRSAKQANEFVQKDTTLICIKDSRGKPYGASQFYNERLDLNICPIEKSYGSTICQLPDAIELIQSFLDNN